MTSLLGCYQDPVKSQLINVTNTVDLARYFLNSGSHLIFLSSSRVFDGASPYTPAYNPTNPKTEYGRQKAIAEKQLLDTEGTLTIVRLSKVLSPTSSRLVEWIYNLKHARNICPFYDLNFSPMPVRFVTNLLQRILEKRFTGIAQASAICDITYEDAAYHLCQGMGYDRRLITPISSEYYKHKQHSPAYTTLQPAGLDALGLVPPHPLEAILCQGTL